MSSPNTPPPLARLLNLKKGTLSIGADADVTIIAPDREWTFEAAASASKSKNNPFYGWTPERQSHRYNRCRQNRLV